MARAKLVIAGAAAVAAVLTAAPASAGPFEDYQAVRADWQADRIITPCRWSEQELVNAREVSDSVPDDQYTDFPSEVDRELVRWRSGGCVGRTPDSVRERSPLAGMRIVRVGGRGNATRELVRLRNRGRTTANLGGAMLRNRRGARARLPRGFRVRAGRTVTVRLGCPRGRRRAGVRGSTAYVCRRRAFFTDSGDVARLVDRRGTVVSRRGYGRYSDTVAF